MHTYLLGDESVSRYVRDFIDRLKEFEQVPSVWCPVTQSGDALLKAILVEVRAAWPELLESVAVVPIDVGDGNSIRLIGDNPAAAISGKSVLLLDGAIHSGRMMCACVEHIMLHSPAEVSSYGLVVKRGTVFIPTLWGLMINETDRAYFLLDKIPNNRLNAGKSYHQPPVVLQLLNEKHLTLPKITSHVESIDRLTWSDRHYQMQVTHFDTCTYMLERGKAVVGFLTVQAPQSDTLSVNEVVVDSGTRGKGYGGVLLRFADTLARQANCKSVKLHAIKNKVEFYGHFGYHLVPGAKPIFLDDEEYQLMEHKILYADGPWR